MDIFLIAGVAGALIIGGLALTFWYRTRLLERRTERLLARISTDIDQLILRHDPPEDDSPGRDSLSRAA